MKEIKDLLQALADGKISVPEAMEKIGEPGFSKMDFACIDHDRPQRCGMPEVVFAEHKTPEHTVAIMGKILSAHGHALATRVPEDARKALEDAYPEADINTLARTVLIGNPPPSPAGEAPVVIVAAGTSDLPVAEEAAVSATYAGCAIEKVFDVGVAGIHRLLAQQEIIRHAAAVIVVAGMEGALPSVVGGLVPVPVIAVPTSVGYGASFGGIAALLGMLNSCAAGVAVVNIDNGFGAGACAARMVLSCRRNSKDEQ